MLKRQIINTYSLVMQPSRMILRKTEKVGKTELIYKNGLFSINISDNVLRIKTKILSPSMFIRHNFIEKYDKIGDDYIIETKGKTIDYYDAREIVFNSENKIPLNFFMMTKRFYNKNNNICNIDVIKDNMEYKPKKEISDILSNMFDPTVNKINILSWKHYEKCGYYEIHEIHEINEILINETNKLNEKTRSINNNIICSRYHSKKSNSDFYRKIIYIINEEKFINLKFCTNDEQGNNNIILDSRETRFNKFVFNKINFESLVVFDEYLKSINKKTKMTLT